MILSSLVWLINSSWLLCLHQICLPRGWKYVCAVISQYEDLFYRVQGLLEVPCSGAVHVLLRGLCCATDHFPSTCIVEYPPIPWCYCPILPPLPTTSWNPDIEMIVASIPSVPGFVLN